MLANAELFEAMPSAQTLVLWAKTGAYFDDIEPLLHGCIRRGMAQVERAPIARLSKSERLAREQAAMAELSSAEAPEAGDTSAASKDVLSDKIVDKTVEKAAEKAAERAAQSAGSRAGASAVASSGASTAVGAMVTTGLKAYRAHSSAQEWCDKEEELITGGRASVLPLLEQLRYPAALLECLLLREMVRARAQAEAAAAQKTEIDCRRSRL